jgi:hypothetical protein
MANQLPDGRMREWQAALLDGAMPELRSSLTGLQNHSKAGSNSA